MKLNREVQRLRRKIKERYYREICNKLEDLYRLHSPKLYTKLKELKRKKGTIRTVGDM